MESRPEKKRFWMASFATHASRGLIRDQKARRKMMMAAVIGALVLILAGSTFLRDFLNPKERALAFVIFWVACAWLTVLAMLLALFDLLIVRAQARAARRALRKQASARAVTQADEGAANASKRMP